MDEPSYFRSEETRVLIVRGSQSLNLRLHDVTVDILTSAFKIKRSSLFLEEDITQNAEFPVDGRFNLPPRPGSRYKVCGDLIEASSGEGSSSKPAEGSSHDAGADQQSNIGWFSKPWTRQGRPDRAFPNKTRAHGIPVVEPCLRKTIPFVTLTLSSNQKSIEVESPNCNVYVKIPENSVDYETILQESSKKLNIDPEELVILDAQFLQVSNDDKDYEYWKTPSRKFYLALKTEFNQLVKRLQKKRLSLKKRKAPQDDHENNENVMDAIKDNIADLSSQIREQTSLKSKVTAHLECKICKNLPVNTAVVMTACCNQYFGCSTCYDRCTQATPPSCPLCRSEEVRAIPFKGFDGLLADLVQQ